MISKWYRGHEGKQNPLDNFGVIWSTSERFALYS